MTLIMKYIEEHFKKFMDEENLQYFIGKVTSYHSSFL